MGKDSKKRKGSSGSPTVSAMQVGRDKARAAKRARALAHAATSSRGGEASGAARVAIREVQKADNHTKNLRTSFLRSLGGGPGRS